MASALIFVANASADVTNGRIAFSRGAGPTSSACDDDIYTMDPDGSGETQLTSGPACDAGPSWFRDGTKLAFMSGTGPFRDSRQTTGFARQNGVPMIMNADGSQITNFFPPNDPEHAGWPDVAPNGGSILLKSPNGDYYSFGYGPNGGSVPDWSGVFGDDAVYSSLGGEVAYARLADSGHIEISYFPPNGSTVAVTSGPETDFAPSWSPDASKIAFARSDCLGGCPGNPTYGQSDIYVVNADGTGLTRLTDDSADDDFPAWSPDGTKIAFTSNRDGDFEIYTMNADGTGVTQLTNNSVDDSDPAWRWVGEPPSNYPRPKGATPISLPLVPAYEPCSSPNREHGAPLSGPSCSPPTQTSDLLTMGTLDSNGQRAGFNGLVRFDVKKGNPSTTANEADVLVSINMTDVRRQSDLSDYVTEDVTQNLLTNIGLRISDRSQITPAGVPTPNTVQDFELSPHGYVPCAGTSDPSIGSTCSLETTANSWLPGLVKEQYRTTWQVNYVRIFDGGADNDLDTTANNTLFVTSGLFVP